MNAAQRQPVPGSPDFTRVFVIRNDDDTRESEVYRWVADVRPGVGEYMKDRDGSLCEIPHERMHLVTFKLADPEPPSQEEKVEAQEKHLYRTRSRTTATQRANKGATEKQVKYIQFLGRQRRLSLDEMRALTPRKSLSDLSVREAGALIDRLKGNRK